MKKPISFSDLVNESGGKITVSLPAKQSQKRDIYAELLDLIKNNGDAMIVLANAVNSKEAQPITVNIPHQEPVKRIVVEEIERGHNGMIKSFVLAVER
jgi:hypothetical protein